MKLYPHQQAVLDQTKGFNRVAYYLDMGLGKTYVGSEKMMELDARVNLVICQKSKVNDWLEHFELYRTEIYDLTDRGALEAFLSNDSTKVIGVINYDLIYRRPELLKLKDFTLMLDESSLMQNEQTKRAKAVMKMNPQNVILLSGTPTGGKYEKLWTQCRLLGWNISRKVFWQSYIVTEPLNIGGGVYIRKVVDYQNVSHLKRKLREHGAVFLKTDEVLDLPQQTEQTIKVDPPIAYRVFRRKSIVTIKNNTLVGDTTLTQLLHERQLCGMYCTEKLNAFKELAESTEDRLVVFYNFNQELEALEVVVGALKRPTSHVKGDKVDLLAYEEKTDSITLVQYQAGAMGLNLQKANKVVYFTPPLSSELYEQSKKRIHRIGQEKPCFYYRLTCRNSVEEHIYETLEKRKDFTEELFKEVQNGYI